MYVGDVKCQKKDVIMGEFDGLCESVVRELKQIYPLKLYLIAPYITQKINRDGKYYKELYDDIIIPDLDEVHFRQSDTVIRIISARKATKTETRQYYEFM